MQYIDIQISDKLNISLKSIHMFYTYAGWLEGYPTEERNRALILHNIENAKAFFYGCNTISILCEQKPLSRELSEERRASVMPMSLPLVTCFGLFESQNPARDPEMEISILGLVWYQDEFSLPMPEEIIKKIKQVNWH